LQVYTVLDNTEKLEQLREAFGERFSDIELYSADLNDSKSLAEAVSGCEYVLHVASPFPAKNPKKESDVIDPAVHGTKAILEACRGSSVKRLVITSSCAAVTDYAHKVVDESTWPEITKNTKPYYKSKILAEKCAWDFIDNLEGDEKFELNTCNPGFVIGPLLNKQGGASQDIVTQIMKGKLPGLPPIHFPVVDVRDVADAHIKALT
jgi:dihydroflavonol-4-reductase